MGADQLIEAREQLLSEVSKEDLALAAYLQHMYFSPDAAAQVAAFYPPRIVPRFIRDGLDDPRRNKR